MAEIVPKQSFVDDPLKRQTLKGACGALAVGSLMPSIARATGLFDNQDHDLATQVQIRPPLAPIDMEAVLVSIPGRKQASLFLQNLTDDELTVRRFHANKVIFDGEIIDCNDACFPTKIVIPAQEKELVQFKPQGHNGLGSPIGEFLDVQQHVRRLPEGTRYIRLVARMLGQSAVLSAMKSGAIAS